MATPIGNTIRVMFRQYFRPIALEMKNFHYCNVIRKEAPSVLVANSEMSDAQSLKIQKISKAMKAYLERAKRHEEFIEKETREYEIGKRHLANIMGVDPDMFTQEDIDKAIEYLMPSGLFEKESRPIMKHPSQVFPKQKDAQFDITGRPNHSLFYTRWPHYHQIMHDIVKKMVELDAFEDTMIEKGIFQPPEESKLNIEGTEWLKKEEFEKMIIEEIDDDKFAHFVETLNRLIEHPYSFRVREFIMKFRKQMKVVSMVLKLPPVQEMETGQTYVTSEGFRKKSVAQVTVFPNGTGKFIINGTDIQYFEYMQDREQLLFPLQFTNMLGEVDVEASVAGGGFSGQAGAIRHGLSLALSSLVDEETREGMRLAGLLTRDRKTRERKKTGQKGARAKYTWKKR
ncbi:small ribosomal subunit protein uS9m [Centruroides vittatus]|uniref:small ribosomal subunit protein uS9m n=1 Tax=Centruroides vittatus TaxID=120091 RepID=UPI00351017C8